MQRRHFRQGRSYFRGQSQWAPLEPFFLQDGVVVRTRNVIFVRHYIPEAGRTDLPCCSPKKTAVRYSTVRRAYLRSIPGAYGTRCVPYSNLFPFAEKQQNGYGTVLVRYGTTVASPNLPDKQNEDASCRSPHAGSGSGRV